MIMDSHLAVLEQRNADGPFLRPDYGGYCFDQLPGVVKNLFCANPTISTLASKVLRKRALPRNVVLLLIDGFGYNQWLTYCNSFTFLRRMTERGDVVPITALFPSTTAASLTTLNSCLTPQQHGLMEWRLFMDELEYPILTLPFTMPDSRDKADYLKKMGVDPRILFDGNTLQQQLAAHDVQCFSFLNRNYADSVYSNLTHEGATRVAYDSGADLVVKMRQHLKAARQRTYFYAYYDVVDALAHKYGPHSEEYVADLSCLLHLLQTELVEKLPPQVAEETVLLVTADHGHCPIDPRKVSYLFESDEMQACLAKTSKGEPILPWGSPRDLFLRVREDVLEETVASLSVALDGKAQVRNSQVEADRGLFGHGCEHPQFRRRIGNVLILPLEGEAVSYYDPAMGRLSKRGMHGGMSHEEMLTQIAFANLAELK